MTWRTGVIASAKAMKGIVLGTVGIVLFGISLMTQAADIPVIASASNFKFALDEIASQFTRDTGLKVRISYGSSGNFVAQIKNGAPFEVFLSADERYVEQLVKQGVIDNKGKRYAVGRLALVAAKGSQLKLDPELKGVKALLAQDEIKRFAIANPDHAPYGERAQELLTALGLWSELKSKLIKGENVAQAAQFALSRSTQGGIIALSLAKAPQFQKRGSYIPLDNKLHQPLYQRMALLPKAGDTAKRFYQYIQSDAARSVIQSYGFGLPAQ